MFVYANLLGTWTELTEDDSIDGCSPQNLLKIFCFLKTVMKILKAPMNLLK